MDKDKSLDKIDKQIEEFEEEQKKYNDMVDETIDQDDIDEINEKLEDDLDNTKKFIVDDELLVDEDEKTKEFNAEELNPSEEEEVVGKHLSQEDREELEEEKVKEKEDEIKEDIKEEVPKKKKKSKKKKIIILIICIIICILIILAIVMPSIIKSKEKKDINTEKENVYTEKKMSKILTNYGEAIENVYNINKNNENKELTYEEATKLVEFPNKVKCKTVELYKDGKLYLDDCTIDGHATKASYGEKQDQEEEAEIADGSFYVYEKDNKYTLETPKNIDEYKSYLVDTGVTPSDIKLFSEYNTKYVFYYDEEFNVHIKNFKTNRDAVAMRGVISAYPIQIRKDYFDEVYVAVSNGINWGIYNLNTGLLDVKMIYTSLGPNINMGISGPPEYIDTLKDDYITAIDSNNNYGVINYKNGEVIVPFETNSMQLSGNYLWVSNYSYDESQRESVITNKKIYDFDGNKYLENKYDDIFGIVEGKYILVKDNKNYKMVLIDGKVLYDYGNIKNIGNINYFIGYNQNPIFQFNKKDKAGSSEKDSCIEVTYDNKTKKGAYKDYYCGGIAKPILYLYPTEQTNVKITFDHPDLLKTTYPKYENEWNVSVDTDGTITDNNGRKYYALYWDEKQKNKVDFKTGYFVTSSNAIKFLEEKLFEIGLTDREANEFIMYWLPILEQNKKSLVYFELTEERNKYNKINIEPKPDSILRLTIHIKKVNKDIKIKEQKIKQFNRVGFTVVEWGGTTY